MTADTPIAAGRALDVAVADVLGMVPCAAWTYVSFGQAGGAVAANTGCGHADGMCYPSDATLPVNGPPLFSTNINAALLALDQVGGFVRIKRVRSDEWHVQLGGARIWWAETLPLAICHALLAATTAGVTTPQPAQTMCSATRVVGGIVQVTHYCGLPAGHAGRHCCNGTLPDGCRFDWRQDASAAERAP